MARIIFQQASVLDGENPLVPGLTVVVENDRITAVTHDVIDGLDGDRVIDLGGKVLMPGMVSAHGHIDRGEPRVGPEGILMAVAIRNCRIMLESGFTGMASAGVSHNIDTQLKICIDAGLIIGPRILAGSTRLNTTGYVNDLTPWWKDPEQTGSDVYLNGPEEFRHAVRTETRRGAEIIKIFPTGGRGFKTGKVSGMSPDELVAAVDAAHERGVKVRAHVVWHEQILACLEAGVDVLDHADELDEQCIELMVEKGTYWVPSLALVDTRGFEHRSVVEEDWVNVAKMLPVANDAGVKILAGDDYGVPDLPHALGTYAKDFVVCVEEFGIKPLDALRWATRHGAELLGLAGEIGTVAPGAFADLVVVNGDPSSDPSILLDPKANIAAVVKGGEFITDDLTDNGRP
jgi:imidazolonepropionase-like amidohydrolase